MRDIGRRIERYRLSRYGSGHAPWTRHFRWVWLALAGWLAYTGLLSDHSLLRLWRLSAENAQTRAKLEETKQDISRLERRISDPRTRRDWGERTLRERDGMARPGEVVYRYGPPAPPDSLTP